MRAEHRAEAWFIRGSRLSVEQCPAIDFQMHTTWTDGDSSVSEMLAAAETQQLDAIAFTEHVNSSSDWYPNFVAEVKAERTRFGSLKAYFGAEIAAADYQGGLKADPDRIEMEVCLGVVHRPPRQDGSGFWDFEELTADDAVELEIRALLGLATSEQVDVIGHPGGTAFKKFGAFPVEWLEPVFCAARDHEVAVELNGKYTWDLRGMLDLLRRVDPLVSFGSDAHHASEVGAHLELFREEAPTPARGATQ
jgi:putative hydrolase